MYSLSWFQNWILRKIVKKLVIDRNQDLLFDLIYETNRSVFHEDNHFTHIEHMKEQITDLDQYKLMKLKEMYFP